MLAKLGKKYFTFGRSLKGLYTYSMDPVGVLNRAPFHRESPGVFGSFLCAGCAGATWVRGRGLESGMGAWKRCMASRVGCDKLGTLVKRNLHRFCGVHPLKFSWHTQINRHTLRRAVCSGGECVRASWPSEA